MPYCSVLSCRNQSRVNNLSNGGISYHRFPQDPYLREKWIDATGRQNWMPTKLNTICSHHFDPKCFDVKKSGYRYISEKAVPTRNIVKFYETEANEENIKEEPLSDSDANEEPTSRIPNIIEVKIEPNTSTDFTYVWTETGNNTAGFASTQNETPEEQRLKGMLRGRNEMVRKQRMKIKQLQSKLRRLTKKYEMVEGELKQRKIEDDQMGIAREKYVHKEPEDATKSKKRQEIEFVRV